MGRLLKDKKIIIYRKEGGQGGFDRATYKPIHPGKLWAYTRQLSAKELWSSQAQSFPEERLFAVGWRNDLYPGMLVQYRNDWYHVVRVDPFEDYKEDIKMYVKTGSKPVDGDILAYE